MKKATTALVLSIFGIGMTAASGCSAPDPGQLTYGGDTPTQSSGTSKPTPTPTGTGTSTPPPASTGGGNGGDDAGAGAADTGAPSAGAFLGESTPWASAPTAATARAKHQTAGQTPQTPGMDCLTCHGSGGPGIQFLAAGYVSSGAGSTNGASDAEVRVWSATSQAGASAHSDADGFFWIKPTGSNIAAPFQVGVRNATATKLMPVDASGGSCNGSSCHGGGQGPVHL